MGGREDTGRLVAWAQYSSRFVSVAIIDVSVRRRSLFRFANTNQVGGYLFLGTICKEFKTTNYAF